MDNQTQPNIPPFQTQTQTPAHWGKIILFTIFGLIVVAGSVFVGIQIGKKQSDIPSPTVSNIPTASFHLSIPSSTPIIDNYATESLKLNVLAMGGGIETPRYTFTFTIKKQPTDTINVLKVRDPENQIYQGATDTGFVVKHENIELEVSPSFEGAGTPIANKLNTIIINNPKLVTGPIYRLKEKDVMGDQNSRGGFDYTTQYSENPEVCKAFNPTNGPSYPACISSGFQVFIQGDYALSIHCSAEDEKAIWCDDIVKSLNVIVNKY